MALKNSVRRVEVRAGAILLLVVTAGLGAEPALAIPAFTRWYHLPCHFCHDGLPKLSVIGEQFKERGLHMQQETFELNRWLESVPATLRTGGRRTFIENGDDDTAGFFKLVSAGALGSRASYWVDQTWTATGDGFERIGTDNAWGRVEALPRYLYIKGGRLELDLPFSQSRSPHLFEYEIYFANTGFESDNIGQHQDGIEAGGSIQAETHWSVAVVKGQNDWTALALTEKADRFDGNVYARFQHRWGSHRMGAFAYFGNNVLAREIPHAAQGGSSVLVWDDDLLRIGGDGSYYLGNLHIYGVFLHGRNDNSIADANHPEGTGEKLTFAGGFVQGDYYIRDEIVVSTRISLVHRPPGQTSQPSQTFLSFFPGLHIGFLRRLRISFEAGLRDKDRGALAAIQAELAL